MSKYETDSLPECSISTVSPSSEVTFLSLVSLTGVTDLAAVNKLIWSVKVVGIWLV